MEIEVTRADSYVTNLSRRMEFHFGNVVAKAGPHHILDLELKINGQRAEGVSMVGMTPMWFLKDPDLSLVEATEQLLEVFNAAREHALTTESASTVFELWYNIYERQREWGEESRYPSLLWAYGVSMIEQGLIDAFCRNRGITFGEGIRNESFGVEPGRIYPELVGIDLSEHLPDEPSRETAIRHTVGLTDPLCEADLKEENRLEDGLPQTLEEYVEHDGVRHFKIKLSADEKRDADRLARIGEVLRSSSLEPGSWFCTVDANEQYESVREFKVQWERHVENPSISAVIDAVEYVEQPLPRDKALSDETKEVLTRWDNRPAIIIDESDDRLDSTGRALECGYAGTSHKNGKGVFSGVIDACLIEKRRRENDREYVVSGEDLTTIGPVELLHDLAVMGSLGMSHVERNGHHYYRGLDFLSTDFQETVLEAHGDLYRQHEKGFATLAIEDGQIEFDSVVDAPFGRNFEFDPTQFVPLEEWEIESTLV